MAFEHRPVRRGGVVTDPAGWGAMVVGRRSRYIVALCLQVATGFAIVAGLHVALLRAFAEPKWPLVALMAVLQLFPLAYLRAMRALVLELQRLRDAVQD